jgi:hypothetical protein
MIRFASYRTACKLRFMQKKANRKLKHAIHGALVPTILSLTLVIPGINQQKQVAG